MTEETTAGQARVSDRRTAVANGCDTAGLLMAEVPESRRPASELPGNPGVSVARFSRLVDAAFFWLARIATLPVLFGAVSYLLTADDRRRQLEYSAWQVINTASGKSGSGGRYEALRQLEKAGLRLSGANLTAWVDSGVQLRMARLSNARLDSATLVSGSLWGANLTGAFLRGAKLVGMDLRHAGLEYATLDGVALFSVRLDTADLWQASLRGGFLDPRTTVEQADLALADLRNVTFLGSSLNRVYRMTGANVCGAQPSHMFQAAIDSLGAVCIEDDGEWRAYRDSRASRGLGPRRPRSLL